MDILESLRVKVGFTDTESKIADYVIGHSRQISGMSAEALAKATFSSKASVIRMCRKIGLSGYREFQIVLTARERRVTMFRPRSRAISPTLSATPPTTAPNASPKKACAAPPDGLPARAARMCTRRICQPP